MNVETIPFSYFLGIKKDLGQILRDASPGTVKNYIMF